MKSQFLFITNIPSAIFLVATTVFSTGAWGSACCGGNFSGPALITGDDQALISQTYSHAKIDTDVEASGLWRKREDTENLETLQLQASHIFWDRWQAGASVPVIKRTRYGTSSSGLGDTSATLGYEYLPDWDYHPIRPKGVGYLQLILPTGKSIYESNLPSQIDARGRGFWAFGIGTTFTKNFSRWDVFSAFDWHRSFERNNPDPQSPGRIKPGWGGSAGAGGGLHFGIYRLGGSLTWAYEDAIEVEHATSSSKGAPQRFVTVAASLSCALKQDWSLTAQIADQGLLGSPLNTTLSQSFSLQLQKRWLR